MLKRLTVLFVSLVLLTLSGCGESENVNPELTENTIEILSVTPNSDLEDGVLYNFSVDIAYQLATVAEGELLIGFNTRSVTSFDMLSSAEIIVEKGSGQHTFEVSASAQDWGSDGSFKVYVNISEHPHPARWTPLASDSEILHFTE